MLSSVMLTYERPQVRTLIERLTEPPRTIVAVFGPRQSGEDNRRQTGPPPDPLAEPLLVH